MAKVSKVVLNKVQKVRGSDDVQVQVDYEVQFLKEEVGQTFQIKVELVESDIGLDDETPLIGSDPDVLYTFTSKPSGPFVNINALKGEVVVKPGQLVHSKSLTAKIDRSLLDEDPGETKLGSSKFPIPGATLPHPDEISARVSVTHQRVSAEQPVPEVT